MSDLISVTLHVVTNLLCHLLSAISVIMHDDSYVSMHESNNLHLTYIKIKNKKYHTYIVLLLTGYDAGQ